MFASRIASTRRARHQPREAPSWRWLFTLRQESYGPRGDPGATAPGGAFAGQRDDHDDFERLFMAHETMITGYLYRLTGDAQSASDLSQETFLRAWQRFERIQTYERPGAWLIRVATNLALQHRRRRRAPVGAAIPFEDSTDYAASDPGSRFAERDHVRAALLELPARARAMLVLREVYGLSGEEVAGALAMSPGAVKVALWRARAQFRAAYLRRDERS